MNLHAAPDAYARAALDSECAELAGTRANRNDRLNRAAYTLGGFVGAGRLDEDEVARRLFEAAIADGYVGKDGRAATESTIRSGLEAGKTRPRAAPPERGQSGRPRGSTRHRRRTEERTERAEPEAPPIWTEPDASGRPTLTAIRRDTIDPLTGEIRRHVYRDRFGRPVRIKVKTSSGWSNHYLVLRPSDGATGWQAKKPAGYRLVPYIGPAGTPDPFDPALVDDPLFWPEGERDVDTLAAAGALALTFGGASDVPAAAAEWLRGRHVVVVTDNDDPGRTCGGRKVALATPIAASVRRVDFPDLSPGGDVTDWFEEHGGTVEALLARAVDAEPEEQSASAEAKDAEGDLNRAAALDNGVITQDGVARLFAERFAGKLRFCHHTGGWFRWSGMHWRRDETDAAFQYARQLGREATDGATNAVLKEVRKVTFANGVERFARGDEALAVLSDVWDRDLFLLGTPGGTTELRSGELRPPDPADGITKLTAVAPAEAPDCPTWLRFLDEVTQGDAGYVRFIRQWGGYCLTGDTREQALCFAYGGGGNGKGVLIRVLTGILADYAMTAQMETFTASKYDRHPTEIASLRGRRLVTASETEQGRQWAESRIKQLTGGDTMRARYMRQDEFEFVPVLKLLLIGNDKPSLSSVDDAARRRFNLLPFEFRPAVADLQLEEKLRAEWPAILRWLIEGCLDWQANGLVRPTVVSGATAEYFAEQDVLGRWLEERCIVERANDWRKATTQELFASWSRYAQANGEMVGSERAFSQMLQKRGFATLKNVPTPSGTRARGFSGIELRRDEQRGRSDA